MDNDLIDLISFELFLPYLEIVISNDFAVSEGDVPDTYLTSRVSNKEPAVVVELKTVRVDIVKDSGGGLTY